MGADAASLVEFEPWYLGQHPRVLAMLSALAPSFADARDITDEAFARALGDWPRVRTAAYFDAPPDEEWNQSVILIPDDEMVVFVNGRDLERETLLAVAASLHVNR